MDINSELINVITSNLLSIIMAILITGWMIITLIKHRNIRNIFFRHLNFLVYIMQEQLYLGVKTIGLVMMKSKALTLI